MPLVDTTYQSSPTTEHLRKKLRSIIKLTRMVSGINYAGHPTLRKCSIRNETGSRLKSHKTVNEVLLHATASIFMRDHEVVAVAASYGRLIAVEGWTEETTAGEPLPASE